MPGTVAAIADVVFPGCSTALVWVESDVLLQERLGLAGRSQLVTEGWLLLLAKELLWLSVVVSGGASTASAPAKPRLASGLGCIRFVFVQALTCFLDFSGHHRIGCEQVLDHFPHRLPTELFRQFDVVDRSLQVLCDVVVVSHLRGVGASAEMLFAQQAHFPRRFRNIPENDSVE